MALHKRDLFLYCGYQILKGICKLGFLHEDRGFESDMNMSDRSEIVNT